MRRTTRAFAAAALGLFLGATACNDDELFRPLNFVPVHALFERYAAAARAGGSGNGAGEGRITLLVSHRFSTVRMADLIVVLDGRRVAQVGTHEDLMARGGPYAELYGIQAAAYR